MNDNAAKTIHLGTQSVDFPRKPLELFSCMVNTIIYPTEESCVVYYFIVIFIKLYQKDFMSRLFCI